MCNIMNEKILKLLDYSNNYPIFYNTKIENDELNSMVDFLKSYGYKPLIVISQIIDSEFIEKMNNSKNEVVIFSDIHKISPTFNGLINNLLLGGLNNKTKIILTGDLKNCNFDQAFLNRLVVL